MAELVVRFLIGGTVVSLFAVLGELWRPKTFAGLFGAAPSVAIATLALAFHKEGAAYVATEARAMVIGTFALLLYSAACVGVARARSIPIWLGAALAWIVWFAAAWGAAS